MHYAVPAIVLVAFLVVTSAVRAAPARLSEASALSPGEPQRVVLIFLSAVDRGELRVLGGFVYRSMITPVRVEYIYDLEQHTPTIRIYATLKSPIAVPGCANCRIAAISAVLTPDGRLIDVESHVRAE